MNTGWTSFFSRSEGFKNDSKALLRSNIAPIIACNGTGVRKGVVRVIDQQRTLVKHRHPAALLILALSACSSSKAPSAVYEEYNQRVIAGMSFEDEMEYYTRRKRLQVEEQFPELMSRMDRTRAEVIETYQRVSREVAKCMEITLADERIDGATALLVYDQTNTCEGTSADGGASGKQSIRMIDEGGWKIDEVEIAL